MSVGSKKIYPKEKKEKLSTGNEKKSKVLFFSNLTKQVLEKKTKIFVNGDRYTGTFNEEGQVRN